VTLEKRLPFVKIKTKILKGNSMFGLFLRQTFDSMIVRLPFPFADQMQSANRTQKIERKDVDEPCQIFSLF